MLKYGKKSQNGEKIIYCKIKFVLLAKILKMSNKCGKMK